MTSERTDDERDGRAGAPRALGGALAAGTLGLGWVLCDLATFGTSGGWRAFEPLWGASAVAVLALGALGALLALAAGRRPAAVLGAWLFLVALSAAATRLFDLPLVPALQWLPRAMLVGSLAGCLALAAARALGRGLFVLSFAAGLAGAVLAGLWRQGPMPAFLPCGAAALALAAASLARPPALRAALGVSCVAGVLALSVLRGERGKPLPRPDLRPPDAAGAAEAAAAQGPSLLLVVLDTVRATHLAPWGYGRDTMPALGRLLGESATRYANARSATSWTTPSHASLLSGLAPAQHGATHPRSTEYVVLPATPLRDDVPTLATLLRERGHRTGAVVANSYALRHQLGLDRGFERYDGRRGSAVGDYLALAQLTGRGLRAGHVPYRDARVITDEALRWLDGLGAGEPFFLMLNYLDAHLPYLPLPEHARAFADQRPRDPLAPPKELHALLYDRELLGLDREVARLFETLRERGRLEDTVVVVTSDHGESFGERGFWKHDWTLYDETLHVPLWIKPVAPRERAVALEPVSGADVPRLALAAMGLGDLLPAPSDDVDGEWYFLEGAGPRALEPWASPPAASPERVRAVARERRDLVAWIEGTRKVIVSSAGAVEAFDLGSDPGEEHPLSLADEERERWLERARAWWRANPPLVREGSPADAEELEHLRRQAEALGYAGG